jgi:DHA2 family multidrug resistance protein
MAASGQGAREAMAAMTARFAAITPDPDLANRLAQSTMVRIVARESLTIGFDEVFRIMAWMFLAALVIVPFCRALPGPAPVNPADVH